MNNREDVELLLVDDNADLLWLLAENMRLHGFTVHQACDRHAAKAIVSSLRRPFVIVLDWMLSDGPARDLLESVWTDVLESNARVIIASGWPIEPGELRWQPLRVLQKPFEPRDLVRLVESAAREMKDFRAAARC